MIALIPARAGSQRVPGKNTRLLGGVPLYVWTVSAAVDSGIFSDVVVCSDEEWLCQQAAMDYGVRGHIRPPVSDRQPDVEWVREVLRVLPRPYAFAILRPTSPFRTGETIRRAFREFRVSDSTHDSLRAVEPVKQHPGKMWTWEGPGFPIRPLLDKKHPDGTPWHSSPTQSLPPYYVQNSSLEMGYTSNVEIHGTISGRKVIPFFTTGLEGFSIDYPEDFERAQALVAEGAVARPALTVARVP